MLLTLFFLCVCSGKRHRTVEREYTYPDGSLSPDEEWRTCEQKTGTVPPLTQENVVPDEDTFPSPRSEDDQDDNFANQIPTPLEETDDTRSEIPTPPPPSIPEEPPQDDLLKIIEDISSIRSERLSKIHQTAATFASNYTNDASREVPELPPSPVPGEASREVPEPDTGGEFTTVQRRHRHRNRHRRPKRV